MGILSSIFGGGTDVEQNTDVSVVNENTFSPNVIVDVALEGLDALGAALREGFGAITRQSNSQSESIDQGAFNIATAIDGAGVNISGSLIDASENIENSVNGLGANIGFALVVGASVLAISGALRRGK